MRPRWREASAVLLVAAAIGAIVRSANAGIVGRVGGVTAALVLVVTAVFGWRGERWATGFAFIVALCWACATLTLVVQGTIGFGESLMWLVWSAVVAAASVWGRDVPAGPRFPPLRTGVGEDERDG
jgi:hypothetical protein